MKKPSILIALLAQAALCSAAVIEFDISPPGTSAGIGLSPLNETIPTPSSGSGNEIGSGITFNTSSLTLSLSIGYGSSAGFTDLTGPAFAWFLHGPASTTETAPVLFDLSSIHTFASDHSKGGTIIGSVSYTAAQGNDLFSGLHYINIYTDANLGGEIRGQLIVVPEPSIFGLSLLIGIGWLALAGLKRLKQMRA